MKLPIDECLPALAGILGAGGNAVLVAEPGAGKTTRTPLHLLQEPWLAGQGIIMLEPRRLAARSAAAYMAGQLSEQVGETVGYRIRMDSRVSPRTRITVVTEGILTMMLQNDPALLGTGLVIFDEFHERSLQSDLGLALSRQSQQLLREDLRLLVMSATLKEEPVAKLLGDAEIVRSPGRVYPVETRYLPERSAEPLEALASRTALAALREHEGNLLVFLPGIREIRGVESRLAGAVPSGTVIAPLYGGLTQEQQQEAIKSPPGGKRKIVLATSIAESSLTVEGITVVIDSGLRRTELFSPRTGMGRLTTVRAARDSADQRRGRAGRTAPGVCYRLWSEAEERQMAEATPPEMLEADLAPLALALAAWGAEPSELDWLDEPPQGAYQSALALLRSLGALDGAGRLTEPGREMAGLGMHPRLARMLLEGRRLGHGRLACLLAALLEDSRVLRGGKSADAAEALAALLRAEARAGYGGAGRGAAAGPGAGAAAGSAAAAASGVTAATNAAAGPNATAASSGMGPGPGAAAGSGIAAGPGITAASGTGAGSGTSVNFSPASGPGAARGSAGGEDVRLQPLLQVARRWAGQLGIAREPLPEPEKAARLCGLLLAFAYPDRIGRRRGDGRYLLSSGRGAAFTGAQPLAGSEYIVAAEVDDEGTEGRILWAAALERELIETHLEAMLERARRVVWDDGTESVRAWNAVRLGAIVYRETPEPKPSKEDVQAALLGRIADGGLGLLPWTAKARQLQERILFLRNGASGIAKAGTAQIAGASGTSGAGGANGRGAGGFGAGSDGWPDVSDGALMRDAAEWFGPYTAGFRNKGDLAKLNLLQILENALSWEQRRLLDAEAPAFITVPSGSKIAVHYDGPQAPYIAVRLQEMFGMTETPRLAFGRSPLTIHLLSPAGRPVQVTSDLRNFWEYTYFEVKKDLKGRYPKHYWPEDPFAAEATRRVRPPGGK